MIVHTKGLPSRNLRSRLDFFSILSYSSEQRRRAYKSERRILLHFLSFKTKQV